MIEVAIFGPGQRVAGSLSFHDERRDQRRIDDRLDPNLRRPEAGKVSGDPRGTITGEHGQ